MVYAFFPPQNIEALTCADSGVVVGQQKALHPVLHVLQDPAVGQFVPGSLDSQPVQTLRRVVLDHLRGRTQTYMKTNRTNKGTEASLRETQVNTNRFFRAS